MAAPTVSDIINGAVVELQARGVGDLPVADESALGLSLFQDLWRDAVELGAFGAVTEVLASADYTASEGERVFSAGFTITLPTTITDCSTGQARRPRDMAMIQGVNAGSDPQISLYDAHVGAWVRVDGLDFPTACPFGARYRHGLKCALAYRMAASLQRPPAQSTVGYAAGLASVFSRKPSAPRRTVQSEYF
jgi:hypothetical protein